MVRHEIACPLFITISCRHFYVLNRDIADIDQRIKAIPGFPECLFQIRECLVIKATNPFCLALEVMDFMQKRPQNLYCLIRCGPVYILLFLVLCLHLFCEVT